MPQYEIFRATEDDPFGILREPIVIEGNQDGIRWNLMKRTIATAQPIAEAMLFRYSPVYRTIEVSRPLHQCPQSLVVASTHLLAETEQAIPPEVLEACRDAALAGVAIVKTGGTESDLEALKGIVPDSSIRLALPFLSQVLNILGGTNFPKGITAQAGPRAIHLVGKTAPKPLPPRPDDVMRDFQGTLLSLNLDGNTVLIRMDKAGKVTLGFDRNSQFAPILDLIASGHGQPVPCMGEFIQTTDIRGRISHVLCSISPLDSNGFTLT